MIRRDLTGQRFGKLVVQYPTQKRIDEGSVVWHCICDCGNEADVSSRRLIRGKARSCGCLSNPPLKDYIGKRFGRLTVVEYAGKASDFGRIGTARFWKCLCDCGKESIVGQSELQNGDTQSCGCYRIEQQQKGLLLIDDTSVVILEQNKIPRSDNKSGKVGVCYLNREQKWAAYITFKKKRYWLGRFRTKEEAIDARIEAEAMHDNFLEWYHAASPKE